MPLRIQRVSAMIAASILHAACATSTMTSKCTVDGPLAALPGMSERAICDRFASDLAMSFGEATAPDGLMVALTLHKRGTINAVLSHNNHGETVTHPMISVDVMDRALRPDDLTRLAQAAAEMLAKNTPVRLDSSATPSKGD